MTQKILFDNHRVRVSELILAPGEKIAATLTFPTVRWQVDDAMDKAGPVKDKQVIFGEAGWACKLQNIGVTQFRQIWFELKKEPRRSEERTREIISKAIYSTDVGTKLLFENHRCRVWDF
jgi:hypothetical protein